MPRPLPEKATTLATIPWCDLCPPPAPKPAIVDAPTIYNTAWAYLCKECYADQSAPAAEFLGTRLLLSREEVSP